MTTILQLNTSLFQEAGASSQLANEFISEYVQREPGTQVITRDLAREPVPHLTAERFQAFLTPHEARTEAQRAVAEHSDGLIRELQEADVIVLGLPLYNFGIPSTLKAYFDHVARAGITFRYTANGPEGLLKGKQVYVFATRGGKYAGTPLDTASRYIRDFLAFLGITEVDFIYAEGLALGDASKQQSLETARTSLKLLANGEELAKVA